MTTSVSRTISRNIYIVSRLMQTSSSRRSRAAATAPRLSACQGAPRCPKQQRSEAQLLDTSNDGTLTCRRRLYCEAKGAWEMSTWWLEIICSMYIYVHIYSIYIIHNILYIYCPTSWFWFASGRAPYIQAFQSFDCFVPMFFSAARVTKRWFFTAETCQAAASAIDQPTQQIPSIINSQCPAWSVHMSVQGESCPRKKALLLLQEMIFHCFTIISSYARPLHPHS